ncbi:MAG: plastocyanin/azurin family copper-binding protein [Armatimonadota bacterium]|nr:plastocyanin/azurin family copper-binding protein [Armatimonadota bacterium]
MKVRVVALIAAGALAPLVAASPLAAKGSAPRLVGTVGPGFTITLKTATGKPVKKLKPGSYTFVVTDKSSIHNFHLTGPGVNKEITGVAFTGRKTVTLTLKKGTYRFVCDPHAGSMKGSFSVG